MSEAIKGHLSPREDPDEFVCREDPDMLTDITFCAECPLHPGCFPITEADILDAQRRLAEEEEKSGYRYPVLQGR